jgi:DNA-binding response OmpR family regulator
MLAIRRDRPDVVLLDVHMPGLTGDALGKLIASSKDESEPLIILYSSTERARLEQLAVECGAAGAIEKSPDPRQFLERFERLVAANADQRRRHRMNDGGLKR